MTSILSSCIKKGFDNGYRTSSFDTYVRSFHVYKDFWTSVIDEASLKYCTLKCNDQGEDATEIYWSFAKK